MFKIKIKTLAFLFFFKCIHDWQGQCFKEYVIIPMIFLQYKTILQCLVVVKLSDMKFNKFVLCLCNLKSFNIIIIKSLFDYFNRFYWIKN